MGNQQSQFMFFRADNCLSRLVKFISDYLKEEESFTELCEIYATSRKTGYKWVERYEGGGLEALRERSRARKRHPNAIPDEKHGMVC